MYMRTDMFGGYMQSPIFFWGMGFWFVWDLVWKGLAMWKAAKRNEPWWFVALMLINSVGILPIAYLLVWCRVVEEGGDVKSVISKVKTVKKKKK